jgi:hypothetical protein
MGITVLPCFKGDTKPMLRRWNLVLLDLASNL